jgi:hypothetical protein
MLLRSLDILEHDTTRMNFSISPSPQTVSYAAVRSMKMVPVLSLCSKPASMCDMRAMRAIVRCSYVSSKNLLETQGQLRQSIVGYVVGSNVQVIFDGLVKFSKPVSLEVDEHVKPIIDAPRRINIAGRPIFEKTIAELEEQKLIEKVERHTRWVSNALLVNHDGKTRLCTPELSIKTSQLPDSHHR